MLKCHPSLPAAAALSGAAVMAFELAAVRLVAVSLGTSLFVWTSIIAVILASLGLGGLWGGWLADRAPRKSYLASILLFASILTALVPLIAHWSLEYLVGHVSDLRLSSFLVSFLLFAPGSFLLGAVSPYCVRLGLNSLENSGVTSGLIYFSSTLGSLIGTVGTGFFLFAFVGTNGVIFLASGLVLLAAMFLAFTTSKGYCLMVAIILGAAIVLNNSQANALAASGSRLVDSAYARYQITDSKPPLSNRPMRLLSTDPTGVQSGIYLDKEVSTLKSSKVHSLQEEDSYFLSYERYFHLARKLKKGPLKTLLIGGGAFVFPSDFVRASPDSSMQVVEIDPGLGPIAEKYFAFQANPRLSINYQDGRRFINSSTEKFDVIFLDVFSSSYAIPFELTTKEAISKLRGMLKPEGLLFVNLISAIRGEPGLLFRSLYATYHSIFPELMVFAAMSPEVLDVPQNLIFMGSNGLSSDFPPDKDSDIQGCFQHLFRPTAPELNLILTDGFAPIEYYAAKSQLATNVAHRQDR